MSAPLSFGFAPITGSMYLSRFSDFVSEIVSNTGSWPDGAALEFRFMASNSATPISWPATVNGPTAMWNVDSTEVAPVLDAGITVYRLIYTVGDYELEWSQGRVVDVS